MDFHRTLVCLQKVSLSLSCSRIFPSFFYTEGPGPASHNFMSPLTSTPRPPHPSPSPSLSTSLPLPPSHDDTQSATHNTTFQHQTLTTARGGEPGVSFPYSHTHSVMFPFQFQWEVVEWAYGNRIQQPQGSLSVEMWMRTSIVGRILLRWCPGGSSKSSSSQPLLFT